MTVETMKPHYQYHEIYSPSIATFLDKFYGMSPIERYTGCYCVRTSTGKYYIECKGNVVEIQDYEK